MRYCLLSVLSVLATALLHTLAMPLAPPWDEIRLKHSWNTIPPNWETLGPPPAGTTIDLHIALKPRHENALIDALYEVSEPRSPKYGAHLSREQVAQLVAPHPDTLELIYSWLEIHGVPSASISTSLNGGWLTVTDVPVPQANELLGASYQLYRPTGTNDTAILRTIGYTLPVVLHPHVRTVVPTTFFASPRTLSRTPPGHSIGETAGMASIATALSIRDDDDKDIVPSALRSMYRTGTYVPTEMNRNELGIAGFMDQYPSRDDLRRFMTKYREDAIDPEPDYRVVQVNGGGDDEDHPDAEPNLNMQYAQAIAYPTPHVFYSIGGKILVDKKDNKPDTGDIWLEWLNFMIKAPKVPQTISIPYGSFERDVPKEYADAVCKLFADLGARGVTVLFPSGNNGVGLKDECKVDDSSGIVQFIPEFPATCPYVTTVGGTTGDDPEDAAIISGGGFSIHFDRPPYQKDDVPFYLLKLGKKHEGSYNPAGRGIPDLAAQATKFSIINKDEDSVMSGTSCAVPTVAAVISLLNDYRLYRRKEPFGFLNPWLYGEAGRLGGLNDVTEGTNPGCGTVGFEAAIGWDPVTGLGTPDFLDLQYILDLEWSDSDDSDDDG